MENFINLSILAFLAIACGLLSLLCLLVLHFVSPEYKPSWRMISEYALGRHKWLITWFFIFWGLSSIFLAVLLFNVVTGIWAMIGVVLILVSALGQIMGGLFDVKHKLHGMAFLLGVPTLPIAALLISYSIGSSGGWEASIQSILISAHSTWISMLVMGFSMAVLLSGFKKAGVSAGPGVEPPETLPESVIGLNGYANRLLVLCYILWLVIVANAYLNQS